MSGCSNHTTQGPLNRPGGPSSLFAALREIMPNPDTDIAAAILAGGQASRYNGRPKGAITLEAGCCIVDRELAEIREAGVKEAIIVANEPDPYEDVGVPIIPDLRLGLGPVAGIEAALHHFGDQFGGTLFLPCDLPAIGSQQLARLVDAFRKSSGQVVAAQVENFHLEPLCAVVHNDLRQAVSEALDEGQRRVGALWQELGVHTVEFDDPRPFHNVNTPADLERWRSMRD